jgi:hypothetical protein
MKSIQFYVGQYEGLLPFAFIFSQFTDDLLWLKTFPAHNTFFSIQALGSNPSVNFGPIFLGAGQFLVCRKIFYSAIY